MKQFIAIDVGGTKIAVGVGSEDGVLGAAKFIATNVTWSQGQVLDEVAGVVRDLRQAAQLGPDDVTWVGLGTPGPLDGPILLAASNLHGWQGLNWQTGLESRLGLSVAVANDATAAGLGEWLYGGGRGTKDCLYVTVSTGIGAGIVTNGRLYVGARGNAGEFGHIVMKPDGAVCAAGHRGCLETLASGTAIRRDARERQGNSPYLSQLAAIETKDVFAGYVKGDQVCQDIVDQAADHLALGLSYLVDLFNPEVIVLGGGVGTHAPQAYWQRLEQGISTWALPALAQAVRLVPAQLGEDSGLLGALAVAVMAQRHQTV
ncbi:MAG: ROK family protein [Sulfobacillus acidophilus]|uniref:ROK family protein n=1 Tax=Sulfobacillus acidophilus TaxID=53633 RepID=A0A2T2WDY1_9FIRM|nr:MAG: ROK family protein [Sulfobacillus acidophilus]